MQQLSKAERAERMSRHAHLSFPVCMAILTAFYQNDNRKLAIQAEKSLLTGDQNEALKQRGLTLYDCIIGEVEDQDQGYVTAMFAEWNDQLGEKLFILPLEN